MRLVKMYVNKMFSIVDFVGFTMDFSGERSIMKVGLIGLEAEYEICN